MKTSKTSQSKCKRFIFAFTFFFLISSFFYAAPKESSIPFTKGLNLINFFDTWDGSMINGVWHGSQPSLYAYDEQDFACLKSMGIEVIRLVCAFDIFTDEAYGTGKINEMILNKLDEVCDWAEKYQIYLIIDNHNNHTFDNDKTRSDSKLLRAQLEAVWNQIPPRYKDRSEYILYEIMNEPSSTNAAEWYKIQQDIINLIRTYDKKHTIVASNVNWSGITELTQLKPYKDSNLIYTFHFYEPFLFVAQGATWVSEDVQDLKGLPFPYDAARIPELQGKAVNSEWINHYIHNEYKTEGTSEYINNRINMVAKWIKKNKVKPFAGELGVNYRIVPSDRLAWINTTISALNANNIPYCIWGIDDESSFIKYGSRERFPEDIDKEILEAYGFSMPARDCAENTNINLKSFPDKEYLVYDGMYGKGTKATWINCQNSIDDENHKYCLQASYPADALHVKFHLHPLVTTKFAAYEKSISISFSAKFNDKSQEFKIFLQDTDLGDEAPAWRKEYIVKASAYPLNKWVTIEIPVSDFKNSRGTWSDVTHKWYDLPSQFTWDRFQTLYFDFDDYENRKKGDILIDNIKLK